MALELVFECPRTLKKLRSGPLGKLVEGFCKWMREYPFVQVKHSSHQAKGNLAVSELTWHAAELCGVNWGKMKDNPQTKELNFT